MTQKKPVSLMGRLAVQLRFISMDQLNEATALQGREPSKRIGEIFVEKGWVTQGQMDKLTKLQQDVIAKHRAKQAAAATAAPGRPKPLTETAKPGGSKSAESSKPPPASAPPAPSAQPAAAVAEADTASAASSDGWDAPIELQDDPPAAPSSTDSSLARQADSSSAPLELQDGSSRDPVPPESASAAPPRATPPKLLKGEPAVQAPPIDEREEDSLALSIGSTGDADREQLHDFLRQAVAAGASDVHIHSGACRKIRVHGELKEVDSTPLTSEQAERQVLAALSQEEQTHLARYGELDLCYSVAGVGRFRTNVYRQQRGFDAVFRAIPAEPPSLDELGLPNSLAKFTNYHQGMVLITGPAGCGKSSTLAALTNLINEEREEHILTIEDPIEYLHPSKRCLVNQRHAGRDTASFARALRGALREDPDVIVIGELRDLETISLAMTAAETGHFVLATLHTNNAVRTINRMIGAFPSNQQDQVRTMLSESLRAVVSQRLVPRKDGTGRVPALEILVISKAIGNMIRDQKTVQIRSSIQTGKTQGMMLLEQSLSELVREGIVSREEALRHAEDEKLISG
ncbi:MAG: type IV pilus twitching motility protein PilT [Myxococcota bacterium]